jgi:integrase
MGKMTRTKKDGIYERSGSKIIDKVVKSYRIYENLGPVSLKDAELILNKKVAELLKCRHFPESKTRSLTVLDALNTYWKEHLQYRAYGKDAKYLLSAVSNKIGDVLIKELKRKVIDTYKRERAADRKVIYTKQGIKYGKPISPRTIQAELQQLNMSINYLVDNEEIPDNPIRRFIKVEQIRPKKVMLDEGYENGGEWQALYENADEDIKLVITVLYETGMRPQEAFYFRLGWIEKLNNECWLINVPEDIEKTSAQRSIPVSGALRADLSSLFVEGVTDNTLVCPSPVTRRERTTIKKAFEGAVQRAGLVGKNLTPYALRRTRLTIWDAIDSDAAKYASGHTFGESHHRNYVAFPKQRLFKLISINYNPSTEMKVYNRTA